MTDIMVFSSGLELLGVIDDYDSLMYNRSWYSYSTMELHLPSDSKYQRLISEGNILIIGRNRKKNAYINRIEISEDGTMTAFGYSLLWLLDHRIIIPPSGQLTHDITGKAGLIMSTYVNKNTIDTTAERKYTDLSIDPAAAAMGETTSYSAGFISLLETCTALAEFSGLGQSIDIKEDYSGLVYTLSPGKNKSIDQSTNPTVIFNPRYGNVVSRAYSYSDTDYKSTAYVAGIDGSGQRIMKTVGNEKTGYTRRETYVEASNIESLDELEEKGKQTLESEAAIETYEAGVDGVRYESGWDLGDIVTVMDEDRGITFNKRITEVEEIYENGVTTITPRFGSSDNSILSKISGASRAVSSAGINSGNALLRSKEARQEALDAKTIAENSVVLSITSSNGIIFKNNTGDTVLTAHVHVGGIEQTITEDGVCQDLGVIKWYKGSEFITQAKSITVIADDVLNTQMFRFELEKEG